MSLVTWHIPIIPATEKPWKGNQSLHREALSRTQNELRNDFPFPREILNS